MTTIRKLVVEFGINVDTTPLKRLDTALDGAKNKVGGFNNLKLDGLRNQIKGLASILSGLTIAGAVTGVIKAFQRFGQEEKAVEQVRFQLSKIPGEFEKTNSVIDSTLESSKDLVSRLDLLNAAAASFEIDTNPEAFRDTIALASKLAAILPKQDVIDVAEAFARFRKSGDVEGLKGFGFFTAQELEVLRAQGNEVTQVGINQRTKEFNRILAQNEGFIEQSFQAFLKTGAASSEMLGTQVDELASAIGESATLIKDINTDLATKTKIVREGIEQDLGFFGTLGNVIEAEKKRQDAIIKAQEEEMKRRGISAIQFTLEKLLGVEPNATIPNAPISSDQALGLSARESIIGAFDSLRSTISQTLGLSGNQQTITNYNTFEIKSTDPRAAADEAVNKFGRMLSDAGEQSSNSTIIRGKNQR